MQNLLTLVRQFPVATFVLLAYAGAWTLWIPRWLSPSLGDGRYAPAAHLIGSLAPALAAMFVARVVGASSVSGGWSALRTRITRWRAPTRWWLIAAFGPIAILLVGGTYQWCHSGVALDFNELLRSDEYPGLPPLALISAQIACYGFGEEIGWRGFLYPSLRWRWRERHGLLACAFVVSVVWAGWHLPLLASNSTYREMNGALIAGWFVSMVTGSVLTAWLFEHTDGSVPAVAIFHGLLDLVMVNRGVAAPALATIGALTTIWGLTVAVFVALADRRRRQTQGGPPGGRPR
jgi:membrane protease YdiL (CAAX protease family)